MLSRFRGRRAGGGVADRRARRVSASEPGVPRLARDDPERSSLAGGRDDPEARAGSTGRWATDVALPSLPRVLARAWSRAASEPCRGGCRDRALTADADASGSPAIVARRPRSARGRGPALLAAAPRSEAACGGGAGSRSCGGFSTSFNAGPVGSAATTSSAGGSELRRRANHPGSGSIAVVGGLACEPLEHVEILPLDDRPGVVPPEVVAAVAAKRRRQRRTHVDRAQRLDELREVLVVEAAVAANALPAQARRTCRWRAPACRAPTLRAPPSTGSRGTTA